MEFTKERLSELRDDLSTWRTPAELKARCAALKAEIGAADFFRKAGMTPLQEAIIAAGFGAARAATQVRLVPPSEERPDFELAFPDRTERFEMVETYERGRSRAKDYESGRYLPPQSKTINEVPEILALVQEAANKKAKSYPAGTSLVIYLNENYADGVKERFSEHVEIAGKFFDAIWIYWQKVAYEVPLIKANPAKSSLPLNMWKQ